MNAPPVIGHRDRTTGLVVFGIFEIALAALCLLLVAVMLASLSIVGSMPGRRVEPRAMIPGISLYALAAAAFVWLGIGSIKARRWARALWVCLSAITLCIGAVATPVVWYTTGQFRRALSAQAPSAEAVYEITRIVTLLVMSAGFVVIPGALLLFYGSAHVKRTCEAKDPVARWTDRCPLPVLALSLYAAFVAFCSLYMLSFRGLYPLFGRLVTGPAGYALVILTAAAWFWAARGLYGLKPAAWWGALALAAAVGLSNWLTFWRSDFSELYSQMGLHNSPAAAEVSRALEHSSLLRWSSLINLGPLFVWLLAVRRHFFRPAPPPMLEPAAGP